MGYKNSIHYEKFRLLITTSAYLLHYLFTLFSSGILLGTTIIPILIYKMLHDMHNVWYFKSQPLTLNVPHTKNPSDPLDSNFNDAHGLRGNLTTFKIRIWSPNYKLSKITRHFLFVFCYSLSGGKRKTHTERVKALFFFSSHFWIRKFRLFHFNSL